MSKENFIAECKIFAKCNNDEWWDEFEYRQLSKKNKEVPHSYEDRFQVSWITGGQCGGSCWGNDEMYERESDPERELDGLNSFLENNFANITFLQYKKFDKYIKTSTRTDYEYYGNSTEYTRKYILFEDVYNVLMEIGLIKE